VLCDIDDMHCGRTDNMATIDQFQVLRFALNLAAQPATSLLNSNCPPDPVQKLTLAAQKRNSAKSLVVMSHFDWILALRWMQMRK